jgi:hypothetical protein
MKSKLRRLSGILFTLALVSVGWLLLTDAWHRFQPTSGHRRAGTFALIFVGASFVCLQLSRRSARAERLKGVLLGMAFVLWGGEQFLPAGPVATAIDCAVIVIFVTDLGLIIKDGLGRPGGSGDT